MGVDARMVIKYRGEKPTETQLATWSFDLCTSIGARHFFISDGLPHDEYRKANKAWHAAFEAHPLYEQWKQDHRGSAGDTIRAAVGPAPEQLRRAIDFTCADYYDPDEPEDWPEEVPEQMRRPGLVYFQDADPVFAEPGEWLLRISLWTRYYGVDYERGDILTICAVAEWCEANLRPCEVWYGGDSSGVELERFDDARRAELRRHLYSKAGRDYFHYEAPPVCPPTCSMCIPGKPRFARCGWGANYIQTHCSGCGKSHESRDNGATWVVKAPDAQ